jgi:hypothetical protein
MTARCTRVAHVCGTIGGMHPGMRSRCRRLPDRAGRRRARFAVAALACLVLAVTGAGCSSEPADPRGAQSGASSASDLPLTSASTGTTAPAPTKVSTPAPTSAPTQTPPGIAARHDQLTPHGLWWAVDSTVPITASSLANVRSWYLGSPTPLFWGRYVNGRFALRAGELAFARAHHIGVYMIVPDDNCSICDQGGDVCGQDRTVGQARADARAAVIAAVRAGVPARVTLFKDIEQVGSCTGELSAEYLLGWYQYVRKTRYRVGFYGNTHQQDYDFPRAYCAALAAAPQIGGEVGLAQDEPEPAIGAPRRSVGPANAPRFAPYVPRCVPRKVVRIWQYGESTTGDNVTDVDEIVPGTRGLIAPDGSVS